MAHTHQPPPTTVFLSYARADDDPDYDDASKSFMRRLFNGLTAAGLAPWWDRESLPSRGLKFTDEIAQAIRDCDRFVLVVGPGAVVSDYVRAEWEFALRLCKPITPILREGDFDLIPLVLREINTIDCRPARDESAALADLVNRLLQDAPLGDLIGVRAEPDGYITREAPFIAARDALVADAISPTVISAPPSAVAVYGLGGIGKSTLAAALARDCQIRRHFRDGVLWIEVGQTPTVASLQASIGVHFGDTRDNYADERDGALSLSRVLQNRAALILLDDVWDHDLVERFPVSGTACRLLITTRSGKLADLVQGADIRLDTLTTEEGAHLMAKLAGGADDDSLYRQITERLHGHTLAVSLAARQIAQGYADDAADMLRLLEKHAAGPEPFAGLAVDDKDKDLNLALSLALSYDALDPELQRRFRQTGIFALDGSFDRAALAAVWGDADEDAARRPLQILTGAGLLDAAEPGRYTQHGLLRAYARALLADHGEFDDTFNAYADFFTARAHEVYVDLHDKPEEWHQHAADLPDITALGDALFDRTENGSTGDLERAVPFVLGTYVYVHRRMESRKWPWLEMGLNAVRVLRMSNPDDETLIRYEGLFLNQLALAWSARSEFRTALEFHEQALSLYRAVGNRGREATTLTNIGGAWSDLGELRTALEFHEQALSLQRTIGNRGGEAAALNNIGSAWSALGEQRKALDYHEQALRLHEEVGYEGEKENSLLSIGAAWSALGEQRRALEFYEQALPVFRAKGNRRGEATSLNNIGAVYRKLGEPRCALEFFEQALPLSRAVGDRRGEARILHTMGQVWSDLGEKRKGLEFHEQALSLSRAVGDRRGEAQILNNMGGVWSALGDLRRALEFYEEALSLSREVDDRGEAAMLNNIGEVYRKLGEPYHALQSFEQALPLFRAAGNRAGEAAILNNIGQVYLNLGEPHRALQFYEQTLPKFRAVGNRGGEAAALNNIGSAWSALGKKRKALGFHEKALALYRAVGERRGEATTLNNIAAIYYHVGDLQGAVASFGQALETFQDIDAVAEEAGSHLNIAAVLQLLERVDEAIVHTEQGRAILVKYNLPQDAGGNTVSRYDEMLARLRDGGS